MCFPDLEVHPFLETIISV